MPRKVPMTSGSHVNSRKFTLGGIYGRKFARYGLSGWNPIRSGYSCAAAASPGVITSLDIGYDLRLVLQSREKGLGNTGLLYTGRGGRGKRDRSLTARQGLPDSSICARATASILFAA